MSRTSSPANDPTLGLSTRSNVRSNASAVTGSFDGGEKRNPRRTVNTYVRPSGGNDIICAYGGRDVVSGGGGHDLVYGGPGADRIAGGRGLDVLYGNAGRDRLNGRDGRVDRLNGGSGRDSARVDRRRDRVRSVERVG